jgi:hypothetical protein
MQLLPVSVDVVLGSISYYLDIVSSGALVLT